MPDCTILSDSAVSKLLLGLSKDEILVFQQKLEETLRQFSVDAERQYQPEPGVVRRNDGQKLLFRPFTSPTSVGTKIIINPAPKAVAVADGIETVVQPPLRGVLVVCDKDGYLRGVVNAAEVTGFRTSLSAMIPFTWRAQVENVMVFGAGTQALWHLRLALTLRGDEVESITLVNRSHKRAQDVLDSIITEGRLRSGTVTSILDHSAPNYQQKLKDVLRKADVVFCTVSSTKKLFSADDLDLLTSKRSYVAAIGSWTPDMIELDPELLRSAVDEAQKLDLDTGVIVDDRDSVLTHSGEIVQSGLQPNQMLELGEVIDKRQHDESDNKLRKWLQKGLVVYKSVGVSLTDKAAGEAILEMAAKHGIGYTVSDF